MAIPPPDVHPLPHPEHRPEQISVQIVDDEPELNSTDRVATVCSAKEAVASLRQALEKGTTSSTDGRDVELISLLRQSCG